MSKHEHFGDMRKGEPSPSCEQGSFKYAHSYWVGPGKGLRKRRIPYRVQVLYSRVLQLITRACSADRAALIMTAYSYPYDETGRVYIHPKPVSDEETKLWKCMAAYIGESVKLGVPLNVPESLQDALNLGTMFVSPAFRYREGSAVVAIFSNSSSPPLDSEDEKTLARLTGKFTDFMHAAISPENKRFRPHKVSRVLRARNVLVSTSELCATLDGLVELVVSLGLAESAYVRILDEDTNMLKLVAVAGKLQNMSMHSDVPVSKCSILHFASKTPVSGCMDLHHCYALSEADSFPVICVPFSNDLGNIGVLSLLNPPKETPDTADMRIIHAVISTAERAFLDTSIFAAGSKTWARTAFVNYASIASRASDDITHIARELLAGLRRVINFQVGAFVNYGNEFEVFSVLFSSADPLGIRLTEPESQDITGGFSFYAGPGDTHASIVLGDPEAEEWAEKVIGQLEPDMTCMFIRSLYLHDSRWPSCLAVPLVSGGDTLGYLIIGKPKGDRFTNEDIDYCESIRYDLMLLWENLMARIKPKVSLAVEAMLERIETLEQLAVGTAHEIKNPLAVIKGYMQVMQLDQGLSSEVRERIQRLLRQVEQIGRIADDLAGLAKLTTADISLVSLPKLLDEVFFTIESQAVGMGITIVRAYPDDIPEIRADGGKLQQAFLNICRNAIEAMRLRGGELHVAIQLSKDGRSVEVEFRDTGPGISREAMTMLFRPFFTTKRHGTGLGLNISMHIARLHGGTIRATNVPGGKGGAIFTMVLPTTRD